MRERLGGRCLIPKEPRVQRKITLDASAKSGIVEKNRLVPYGASVCFLAAMIFVYMRGQDVNYDLLNYHYYAGYSLLHGRYEYDIAPARMQSFFNPMANVIAYLSLKNLPFPFSGWLILVMQLLSVPALILISRETGKGLGYAKTSFSELLALVLCLISPLWWSELGTTFFSSWTAPLILWSVYLLTRSFSGQSPWSKSPRHSRRHARTCGRAEVDKCALRCCGFCSISVYDRWKRELEICHQRGRSFCHRWNRWVLCNRLVELDSLDRVEEPDLSSLQRDFYVALF